LKGKQHSLLNIKHLYQFQNNTDMKADSLGSKDFWKLMINSFLKNVVKKFCSIWNLKSTPLSCSLSCRCATFQFFTFTPAAHTEMNKVRTLINLNHSFKGWLSIHCTTYLSQEAKAERATVTKLTCGPPWFFSSFIWCSNIFRSSCTNKKLQLGRNKMELKFSTKRHKFSRKSQRKTVWLFMVSIKEMTLKRLSTFCKKQLTDLSMRKMLLIDTWINRIQKLNRNLQISKEDYQD